MEGEVVRLDDDDRRLALCDRGRKWRERRADRGNCVVESLLSAPYRTESIPATRTPREVHTGEDALRAAHDVLRERVRGAFKEDVDVEQDAVEVLCDLGRLDVYEGQQPLHGVEVRCA